MRMILVLIFLVVTSCAYPSSGRMSIKGDNVVYTYDPRTNLCFAGVALRAPLSTEIEQFSMTAVPCNERIVSLSGQPATMFYKTASNNWPYN